MLSSLKQLNRKDWALLGGLILLSVVFISLGSAIASVRAYFLPAAAILLLIGGGVFLLEAFKVGFQDGSGESLGKIRLYFHEKAEKKNLPRTLEVVLAALLFLLFLAHFEGGHDYLEGIDGLSSSFLDEGSTVLALLSVLLYQGGVSFLAFSYQVDSELMNALRKYFLTPLFLILLAFSPYLLQGIVGDLFGNGADLDPYRFRLPLLGLEMGISVLLLALSWWRNPTKYPPTGFYKPFLLLLPVFLLALPNSYSLQVLFGSRQPSIPLPLELNLPHRVYVYFAFLLPNAYFLLLHPFDVRHRRAFLTYIAFLALFGYVGRLRYEIWTSFERLPLHLCNTAMYVVPFTLVFKTEKVFYFTMFINVIGAFIALLMPNYSTSLGTFSMLTLEFYINHLYAFFMPVLIVLLKVYPRPSIRYFLYSMAGFLFYFLFCLVLNTWGTAMGYDVDFFFLNSDYVVGEIGAWAEDIYAIEWGFTLNGKTFLVHPLYLILFYLVYVLLALLMWYVYELLFRAVDGFEGLLEKIDKDRAYRAVWKKSEERRVTMERKSGASLQIEHLRKRYPHNDFDTIKDFSLSLEGGRIYGFLGKNGAGKSTIIKCIVGMHDFDDGKILVDGLDLKAEEVKAKSLIGFVPDHYALYESLTGREYVSYVADLYEVGGKEREERIASLTKRLSMEKAFDDPIATYSHGMKQKTAIIAALVHDPKLWILDEPMTGVDPVSVYEIKETMREHAARGNIVFFSSHLIDVVSNLCDEIIVLSKGNLVYHGDVHALKGKGVDLERLFLDLLEEGNGGKGE